MLRISQLAALAAAAAAAPCPEGKRGMLVEPYPDSMSVSGWQYDCPAGGADGRGNHRLVPDGVTLGDVRRGWRGPCD